MFRSIAEILVKSKLNKENLKRKKSFLTWEQIEKIALILEEEDSLNKSEIDTFIADSKKFVEVFYIELKSKQSTYNDWHCLTRRSKTLLGLPKTEAIDLMKNKQFDLVINTCSLQNLFAISLSSSSHAPLHCATNSLYNEADFMVKRLEGQKLIKYLNNVLIYLKMIKN